MLAIVSVSVATDIGICQPSIAGFYVLQTFSFGWQFNSVDADSDTLTQAGE